MTLGPDSAGRMDFGDTVFATAKALNGRGDSVGATIIWSDLDTLLHVDSLTGAVTARLLGTGLIQARTGSLRSNPQPVVVFPRADTAFTDSATHNPDTVTVSTPDSLSDPLGVRIQNFGTDTTGASGRTVRFTLIYPDTLSVRLTNTVTTTDVTGLAVTQVRLKQRTLPDSAVVQATVTRFNGVAVPGAPITFVVRFVP
ncbi:MAG TPA: hypothetical protein VFD85_12225 [Gemmatimonadales bacterium]|nr:hypothetical protein [Gemmatimonadales bacterium]